MAVTGRRPSEARETEAAAEERRRWRRAEELITVLAHDLRNLLAPLKGQIDLLRRRAAEGDREALEAHAMEAAVGLDRMRRFVESLLDVERLQRGIFAPRMERVDLAELAQEVGNIYGKDGEVMVRVEVGNAERSAGRSAGRGDGRDGAEDGEGETEAAGVWAEVDRGWVRQAVQNVVANAVRHSPPGGVVTVRVESERREDGRWAQLTVRDEGAGLAPEMLPRLFKKFGAGPGSSGLGLGLYLAERIAAAHGGRLVAESPPGEGARFTFELPAERPGAP